MIPLHCPAEDVETEEIELGDVAEQAEDFELPDSEDEDDSDDELGFYGEDEEMKEDDDEVDRMYQTALFYYQLYINKRLFR